MTKWIPATIIPEEWEGTRKLRWTNTEGAMEGGNVVIDVVPVGFSRKYEHCDGWFYAEVPEPPKASP